MTILDNPDVMAVILIVGMALAVTTVLAVLSAISMAVEKRRYR